MRYVPSIRTPVVIAKEGLRVKELVRVAPAKPVQERTLPPLIVQRHAPLKETFVPDVSEEMRHDPHLHGERRTYCRRTVHLPILVELRSSIDRRRYKQRDDDMTEHVDEKV